MTGATFSDLLRSRAERANASVAPEEIEQFQKYFKLLASWNRRINLTALPLAPPTEETIDRLLIEPLTAARFVGSRRPLIRSQPGISNQSAIRKLQSAIPIWFDLGSGGGSPAIPMKIALPGLDLTMVESRSRKAAFLREVLRDLEITSASVENVRFQELSSDSMSVDYITCRAVRTDSSLQTVAQRLLRHRGWLMTFSSSPRVEGFDGFEHVETVELFRGFLHVFARMFHVEQFG